jgi:N-methylhydantoinase A
MRVAFDTGGTFTDCVFVRDGRLQILKVLSTPCDPADAIRHALGEILAKSKAHATSLTLLCGTTVGTNALLERRGGRVTLVTTAGFEDVLEIGRQARAKLYDLFCERPAPLVPHRRRIGLRERVAADGMMLVRPSREEVTRVINRVRASRADSVAVCFLFSFLRPDHEQLLARRLRAAGFSVSVSHEILPEFREFERTATTVANAYLVPVMSRYLAEVAKHAESAVAGKLKGTAKQAPRACVQIMQSNGGILSAGVAIREPVRTILSGPAGGVLGAQQVATRAGYSRVISFDMGGTSTDVSLIAGSLRTTNESIVADLPVAVPMLEIHTVGAGGGSIARFDRGGSLRVGPESAHADPGPICYGRGERPTVTDANLILGRLGAGGLLGGEFQLDKERAARFMSRAIRGVHGMRSVEEFAQGVLDVVEATMEQAIRVISIERGRDPSDYTMVAFGGAGGLHACNLAASLSMPRVMIPKFPGALSALGILCAEAVKDFSRTLLLAVRRQPAAASKLRGAFAALEREGARAMHGEGFALRDLRVERFLDMRYVGQAYELSVPASGDFVRAFHREHEQRYGYADRARPVEIVNIRTRFIGATGKMKWPKERIGKSECREAIVEMRQLWFRGQRYEAAVYSRRELRPGNLFRGPAIVSEYSATTLVPLGWSVRVDAFENLEAVRGSKRSKESALVRRA